jgi:hypothetical protein
MTAFSTAAPFLDTRTDDHGRTWQFAYWGSGFVYIREQFETPDIDDMIIPIGDNASRDDWPYLIGVGDYIGMTPERVTRTWLVKRVTSWITDRNNENPEDTP